jgi:hypothetical protein
MPANERDYSHRSLIEKLGIKREHRVCLRGVTDGSFAKLVRASVDEAPSNTAGGRYDIIILEVNRPADLAHVVTLSRHLVPNGGLWVLHPKGKDANPHDAQVRAAGLDAGLVDNKICAYNASHTATRFVIPVARRSSW